jgi:Tfp pilus assembly protein PilZ
MRDMNATLNSEETLSSITAKLFDIILKMPVDQRRKLLTALVKQQKRIGRKYNRREYLMSVEYSVDENLYNGFIKNISSGGVFIECPQETLKKISAGDMITLTFVHPDKKVHIKMTGEIARIVKTGFGVSFDKILHDLVASDK